MLELYTIPRVKQKLEALLFKAQYKTKFADLEGPYKDVREHDEKKKRSEGEKNEEEKKETNKKK